MNLNYKIIGQGPPVILLHGLFGMLDNLLTLAKRIETQGFMVIMLDQRDHGKSPHTQDFSFPILADDLFSFMSDNWIHNAHIIGHSMGGKTALQFASLHEDMVDKLIIIDIGIKQYKDGHSDIFDALLNINLEKIETRTVVEDYLESKINDHGTVQFLMKNLSRNPEGGYQWKMNINLLYEKYSNILSPIEFNHTVDTPTLFLKGENSNYLLEGDYADIINWLPNAKFNTIQNASHWIHVDQPDALFENIMKFLRN